jgi:hypothetical protein
MLRTRWIGVALVTVLCAAASSFAQSAQPAAAGSANVPVADAAQAVPAVGPEPSAPAQDPSTPEAKPSPLEPQGYAYEPSGRRDPFVSLVRRGEESANVPPGSRPPGLAGLATSEVALRGTVQQLDRGWVAIVQGVDKKSYTAKPGDKLFDGTIRSVTPDSMVILQTVNDPLALETQREVRKQLRQTEEAK